MKFLTVVFRGDVDFRSPRLTTRRVVLRSSTLRVEPDRQWDVMRNVWTGKFRQVRLIGLAAGRLRESDEVLTN